ncbi:MAG: shikimate kinase [Marinobacter sp.]|uniref:shikimate kinase n=1 Tax=Marinobacter sp. TaxID=50741 RepID=UPI0034A03E66
MTSVHQPSTTSNLVLIGMPGSGKSTVGVLLAKHLALGFVDTDLLIQAAEACTLQSIVDDHGYKVLRGIEERELQALTLQHHVIATGGSAVYSTKAMAHLKTSSTIVFLKVTLETVEQRIGDFSLRGISKREDQSLAELFAERHELYSRSADIVIACDGLSHEQVCNQILEALESL